MVIQKLNKETKEKIVAELMKEHKIRYGTKADGDGGKVIPKRKTYLIEDLEEDLKFTLNHLTL